MSKPRYGVGLFVVLAFGLSFAVPAEYIPEIPYDESTALPYESTPVFSNALNTNSLRSKEHFSRTGWNARGERTTHSSRTLGPVLRLLTQAVTDRLEAGFHAIGPDGFEEQTLQRQEDKGD